MTDSIAQKWQQAWAAARTFESDPRPDHPKCFITAAFPYPNSPQHIGHGRAYTTTDIYARYMRMQGRNVLFPMGFHVTGTPILAMARRIAAGDKELFDIFEKIYGIPPEKTRTLGEPKTLVMHFSKEIEQGMREMGYAIDWRRKFYSLDPAFNKFVQWQFRKLKAMGYLVQGEHPIAWCPKDNQAVGGHDTQGDIDPGLKDFTAIKFAYGDAFLLTATVRPETIYGVTNIWVNPAFAYVKAKSRKTSETYIITQKAFDKMNVQGFDLEVLARIPGNELLHQKVKNPVTGQEVPIYPAAYVKDDTGTGMVTSVPSHAPYDHIALLDMGIRLEYTPIVKVEGYTFMARELVERMGIRDQHDPRLEDIVKEVYKKEILTGIMAAGPYAGEKVSAAIEKTKADLLQRRMALPFWEIENRPIYCRCGAEVVAAVLQNQWFIDYGKPEWKEKARECLKAMTIIPEKTRSEYEYAIDWFKQKACARSQGLGTPFPFDPKLVIEALSDSTIYMAFYTFVHLLDGIEPGEMDEAFFDYVLLGKGHPERKTRNQETGNRIPEAGDPERGTRNAKLEKLRESFLYWYPLDSRHSGADLIRNHLPFFILVHVAMFGKPHWPRQIVTNGFVLMDGKKMSKSLANILPLRKAVAEYGADIVRFSIVSGADLAQDTDFSCSVAEGTRTRLQFVSNLVGKAAEQKPSSAAPRPIERWLRSRLEQRLRKAAELYPQLALRELGLQLFYEVYSELKWALKREPEISLRPFFERWIPAIAPLMPHYAEEFWSSLGQKPFVCDVPFPVADAAGLDADAELGEELVQKVAHDAEKVMELVAGKGGKPARVYIYVAAPWKVTLYKLAQVEKKFDIIMQKCAHHPIIHHHIAEVPRVVKAWHKYLHSLPPILPEMQEFQVLKSAEGFLSNELGVTVQVLEEHDGKHEKAKNALPDKPAIVVE